MRWFLASLLCCAMSQASPAPSSEIVIDPPQEDWVLLTSTAFFRKPTVLIEHRELPKLRGIFSTRRNSVKKGQTFSESVRLKEICKNVQTSYSATRNHIVVDAKVNEKKVPHCRIRVHEKEGLTIEQLLFVSKDTKKAKMYTTHTVTFFYPPSEEEKATKEVTKFLRAVRRGDG